MSSLNRAVRRARPLLGTFFEITVSGVESGLPTCVVTQAFEYAQRLEQSLSKFNPESWPNRALRGETNIPAEFQPLFQLAREISIHSAGAFEVLDLTGISKGWIADRVAEFLALHSPGEEICVNAGGDLRFINRRKRSVRVRLAPGLFREINFTRDAIAVSSLGSSHPSTAYHKTSKLNPLHSVCVMHDSCAVADALTKVVLFHPDPMEVLARYGAESVLVEPDEAVSTF